MKEDGEQQVDDTYEFYEESDSEDEDGGCGGTPGSTGVVYERLSWQKVQWFDSFLISFLVMKYCS